MDVNRINDMVDRKVIQSFQEGFSIGAIQSDLMVRMKNFMKTIEKDDSATYQELYNSEFSQISNIRLRYGITYIKQCEKRLGDLDWILKNRSIFKTFTDLKLFKLLLFKDKITQK